MWLRLSGSSVHAGQGEARTAAWCQASAGKIGNGGPRLFLQRLNCSGKVETRQRVEVSKVREAAYRVRSRVTA